MTGTAEIVKDLQEKLIAEGFRGSIALDVPLATLTYYRIGGPAAMVAEAKRVKDVSLVRKSAAQTGLPLLVLGAGSNLLVSDDGFPGVVMRLGGEFAKLKVQPQEMLIQAGAAAPLVKLLREGSGIGMSGVERLAGIPGWVGGAIYMNAGTFGEYINGLVESVQILTVTNEKKSLAPSECAFAYRSSRFQESGEIILGCAIRGEAADPWRITNEVEKRLEHRRNTQPVDAASCGCVFRNPEGEKTAARLIEEAGLKGARSGDAVISDRHANFILNEGHASARDVLALMALARRRVRESAGIVLAPEVEAVGFPRDLEVMLDERTKD
jgi:UDP-N-acetylmuramate dehydrogenase